ncbi:MAG: hypothetical protein H3C41_11170 [Bacteroidales bacterium]|nr:hypothetical protein [Bacteroidales bacterium]
MADNLWQEFKQRAHFVCNSDMEIGGAILELLGVFSFGVTSSVSNQYIYGPYVQVQLSSGAEGICIAFNNIDISNELNTLRLVGKKVLDIFDLGEKVSIEVQIALVDAIYHHIKIKEKLVPSKSVEFLGLAKQKSFERANYIASLLNISQKDKVAVVGCVAPIVKSVLNCGGELRIADLHSLYSSLYNTQIEKDTASVVKWADKIILTGNALWSQTITNIFDVIQPQSVVLVYAMTAHNIAPYYINYRANIVTAESFPFYWFNNTISKINTFAKLR